MIIQLVNKPSFPPETVRNQHALVLHAQRHTLILHLPVLQTVVSHSMEPYEYISSTCSASKFPSWLHFPGGGSLLSFSMIQLCWLNPSSYLLAVALMPASLLAVRGLLSAPANPSLSGLSHSFTLLSLSPCSFLPSTELIYSISLILTARLYL